MSRSRPTQRFAGSAANHLRVVLALVVTLAALGASAGAASAATSVTAWASHDPRAVAVDAHGHVYVGDTGNNRIEKFTADGTFITAWGSKGSGHGQFNHPDGVAVDTHGHVYVADTNNNRIEKFGADGAFVGAWGSTG